MTVASLATRFAAALLPTHMRDRYREQWEADLRDAEEAEISRTSIAWGALITALSVQRGAPAMRWPDATRRERLAPAFGAVGAVIAISQWSGLGSSGMVTDAPLMDYLLFLVGIALGLVGIAAPVLAVSFAASRGVSATARLSVALLVLASFAPIALPLIRDIPSSVTWRDPAAWFAPGDAVFPIGGLIIVAAVILSRPWLRLVEPPSIRRSSILGVVVTALGAALISLAALAWNGREPLYYGYPDTLQYQDARDEWLALKQMFETRVAIIFILLALAFVALAVIVGWAARRASFRQSALIVVASVAGEFVAYATLSDFLELGTASAAPVLATEPLLAVSRLALALCVLVGASGVRPSGARDSGSAEIVQPSDR